MTYPLAGWLGVSLPLATLAALFGASTLVALLTAAWVWPAGSAAALQHDHPELPLNHPHLAEHVRRHSHTIIIDDLHPRWPARIK